MEPFEGVTVKRIAAYVPVSTQQLLDAGLPLPSGLEPPEPLPALPRRVRWRLWFSERVWAVRRRVGFWIAGYEPDDDWW